MTWVKLDDGFFDCEKVQALLGMRGGKAALLLHFSALTYCSRHLTDGELAAIAIQSAAKDAQVPAAVGRLLLEVKLWEKKRGRVFIHDYLEYNPSRAEVEAMREEKARAGRAGGLASARARATAGAQAKPQQKSSNLPSPTRPLPAPAPDPKDLDPPNPPEGGNSDRPRKPRRHRPMNDGHYDDVTRQRMADWPDHTKLVEARAAGFDVRHKTQAEYESEVSTR